MAKYDPQKALTKKQQEALIKEATDLFFVYRDHWDPKYKGPMRDYRRLAAGKLPVQVESDLDAVDKKKKKSRLIPRLIADHCEDKTGALMNATVNRTEPFRFFGTEERDQPNAPNAQKLVMHEWNHTRFKKNFRLTINDAVVMGRGFIERSHFVDPRLKRKFGGFKQIKQVDYDVVYIGPKWTYVRVEMIYLDPSSRDFDLIRGYFKLQRVPYSSILKETYPKGIYERYKSNVKNIKPQDYNPDHEDQFDNTGDHTVQPGVDTSRDFNVLLCEWWTSMVNVAEVDVPAWHLTSIANPEENPQLIRFDMDAMGNGLHPLRSISIFDYSEPRMFGWALPEKLYTGFLEAFHKRNQRINLVNSAVKRAGVMLGNRSAFPADFIAANSDSLVFTTGDAKGVVTLPIDLTVYQHLIADEQKCEREAERTAKTNPVTLGLTAMRREAATTTATIDQNAKMATLDPVARVEECVKECALDAHEHSLILVPEPYIGRLLGTDRQPMFFKFSRRDILGRFDVICEGSTEIVPKAVRLANANAMVGLYMNAPVQWDKQRAMREHFKLAEFPGAEQIVPQSSDEPMRIDRENGMLSNAIPMQPLPIEDHQLHIASHQNYIQELLQAGADMKSKAVLTILMHVQMHVQLMQAQQGALGGNQKQLPSFGDQGEMLDNVNTDISARMGMAG